MGYSTHSEHYSAELRRVADEAAAHCLETGFSAEGWLEWLKGQGALYAKYKTAQEKIHALWGKGDSPSLSEFRRAVKNEMDATLYAVRGFIAFRQARGDAPDYLPEPAEPGPPYLGPVKVDIVVDRKTTPFEGVLA